MRCRGRLQKSAVPRGTHAALLPRRTHTAYALHSRSKQASDACLDRRLRVWQVMRRRELTVAGTRARAPCAARFSSTRNNEFPAPRSTIFLVIVARLKGGVRVRAYAQARATTSRSCESVCVAHSVRASCAIACARIWRCRCRRNALTALRKMPI